MIPINPAIRMLNIWLTGLYVKILDARIKQVESGRK